MKRTKEMQLGALLAAMLLVTVAFLGAAAPNKVFPKDIQERVLLGLNDSQLQDKEIPDFGPEVLEDLKKGPKIFDVRGKIPRFGTEEKRRNWFNNLDETRINVQNDMNAYIYPKGPVIAYGWDINGYFEVVFYENTTVQSSQVDEVYAIIDINSKKLNIQDIPVVFRIDSFVRPVLAGYDSYYRPIIGAVQVVSNSSKSTLGFSVRDTSGTNGYVVAKHAAPWVGLDVWQPYYSIIYYWYKAGSVSKLGGIHTDASFVPYSNVEASIHLGNGVIAPVKGSRDANIGEKVYISGATTGPSSGYVEGVANVEYPDGSIYYDQVKATYYTAGGDSGAPVYYLDGGNRIIVGINAATNGQYAYFSKVSWVQSELGVTPLTR